MECGHNNQVSTLGFFIFYVSGHWTVDRDSAAQSSQMLNNKELEIWRQENEKNIFPLPYSKDIYHPLPLLHWKNVFVLPLSATATTL